MWPGELYPSWLVLLALLSLTYAAAPYQPPARRLKLTLLNTRC